MDNLALLDETASVLEVLDDGLVGSLDVLTLKVRNLFGEVSGGGEGVGRRTLVVDDSGFPGNLVIVLTESGRLVNNTDTLVDLDVCVVEHLEANTLELFLEVVEWGLVLDTEQLRTLHLFQNSVFCLLGVLVQHLETNLEQNVLLIRLLIVDLDVLEVGVDTETGVRGEGPGSGGPGEEVFVLATDDGEVDDNGRVRDITVVFLSLRLAERSAEGGRVGQDLCAVVDEILFVELLEDPPARLHEGGVHGLRRVSTSSLVLWS
jgi:hypothetical protein